MMDKPTFKNKGNEEVELKDGRKVWLSRSPAVVAVILAIEPSSDRIFVLTEKRSAMMDEGNKWAVVSGYMDWDENGMEAIIRETYEETSFHIPKYENRLVFNNDGDPFYVHTDPHTDAKQNVSLSYIFIFEFDQIPKEIEQFKDKEISEVKWMEISEVFWSKRDWAFNHDQRIEMAVEKYQKYLS
jgi:ADP-ribose pyrophosphatase YjhB (NUDIX family)